jgi:hypothetical protein
LGTHGSTASPNAVGILRESMKVLDEAVQVSWSTPLLPAPVVSSPMPVGRKREDLDLMYRQFCRICRNRAKEYSCGTTALSWGIIECHF